MADWRILERASVRLAVRDFGGEGPTALLLHGFAGHAEEWTETAAWLTDRCHVLALDARGHGRSERRPADVSRAAHVADAVFAFGADGPAILIGQSLGGVTALLVAAERPDLARALVVAEASPAQGSQREVAAVRDALARSPVPFASREAAVAYFGGAEAWADGLEQREDGLWPRFDVDVMSRTPREADRRSYWQEWDRIRCPVLVVRGANGTIHPQTHRP
jgi:pimeloyl-ACP methyl ester carboxylesterase